MLARAFASAGGKDVRLGGGVDANARGYEVSEVIPSSRVMHVRLTKR